MSWDNLKNTCGIYNQSHIAATKRAKRKSSKKKSKAKIEKTIAGFQAELIERKTRAEGEFEAFLIKNNIIYEFQKIIRSKKQHFIVDFYLNHYHTVVEIDGGYHETEEQQRSDANRTRLLKENNIIARILRFKNEDVSKPDFKRLFMLKLCPFVGNDILNEMVDIPQRIIRRVR